MTDKKITIEFDQGLLLNRLMGGNQTNQFDNLLNRFLSTQSRLDKALQELDAKTSKIHTLINSNQSLIRTNKTWSLQSKKVLKKNKIKSLETDVYHGFSKELFNFVLSFIENYDLDGKAVCSICQNTLDHQEMEYISLLSCQHNFHETCLEKSIHSGIANCPNCRAPACPVRIGHFKFVEAKATEDEGETETEIEKVFVRAKLIKMNDFLKIYLETSCLVINSVEETSDRLEIIDLAHFSRNANQYSRVPDILVGDDVAILGSLIEMQMNEEEELEEEELEEELADESNLMTRIPDPPSSPPPSSPPPSPPLDPSPTEEDDNNSVLV